MELLEKVYLALQVTDEQKKKLVKCKWKDCIKTHIKKPKYPDGGTVKRNSTYEDDWVKAKLEPWDLKKPGKNSRSSLSEYRKETPAAKYAVNAAAMKYPKYHTQKHHLLSVNFFENFKALSANAKLAGWDVNDKTNGICLPSYVIDIVCHNLQCHRGPHPKVLYNDKIKLMLEKLDKRCKEYCQMDLNGNAKVQNALKDDLIRKSERVKIQIHMWVWLLRKNAKIERQKSRERYENLKAED